MITKPSRGKFFINFFNDEILELYLDLGPVKTLYVLDNNLNRLPLEADSAVDGSKLYKICIIRSVNLRPFVEV